MFTPKQECVIGAQFKFPQSTSIWQVTAIRGNWVYAKSNSCEQCFSAKSVEAYPYDPMQEAMDRAAQNILKPKPFVASIKKEVVTSKVPKAKSGKPISRGFQAIADCDTVEELVEILERARYDKMANIVATLSRLKSWGLQKMNCGMALDRFYKSKDTGVWHLPSFQK